MLYVMPTSCTVSLLSAHAQRIARAQRIAMSAVEVHCVECVPLHRSESTETFPSSPGEWLYSRLCYSLFGNSLRAFRSNCVDVELHFAICTFGRSATITVRCTVQFRVAAADRDVTQSSLAEPYIKKKSLYTALVT